MQLYPAELLEKRRREVLCDTKWQLFMKRTWLFRHIPFVEAAFGAGSLALGNVSENSDFDVLILATSGRIFSARFFCALAFNLFGWRRKKLDHRVSAKDKVCLNHFATKESYRLQLPPNSYWQALYSQLVPIYGKKATINEFFVANADWLLPAGRQAAVQYQADIRHVYEAPSLFKRFLEPLLSGFFGNWLEQRLKNYQVRRITRGLPTAEPAHTNRKISYKDASVQNATYHLPPLIRYSDTELEFHPDPATVELLQ